MRDRYAALDALDDRDFHQALAKEIAERKKRRMARRGAVLLDESPAPPRGNCSIAGVRMRADSVTGKNPIRREVYYSPETCELVSVNWEPAPGTERERPPRPREASPPLEPVEDHDRFLRDRLAELRRIEEDAARSGRPLTVDELNSLEFLELHIMMDEREKRRKAERGLVLLDEGSTTAQGNCTIDELRMQADSVTGKNPIRREVHYSPETCRVVSASWTPAPGTENRRPRWPDEPPSWATGGGASKRPPGR